MSNTSTEKFQEIFSAENLDKIAEESGFKSRESKITPKMFLDSLLFNASSDANKSLNSLSVEMKQNFNVDVTKQGLHERYTEKTALYLKSILSQLCFVIDQPIDEGWFGHFNSIYVKDSTKFVLPEEYAQAMPGFGGVSSKSAACIQYEYDLKTGSIHDLTITPANRPDTRDAQDTKDNVKPKDLVIRDLGYFSIDVLRNFIDNGAYIISKLHTKPLVYEVKNNKYELLDFNKLYRWMKKNKVLQMEKKVCIGAKSRLPIRLVIETVPDEVFAQRMSKINKYNKRMGFTTSSDYADRARLNLIITNVSNETIPAQAIVALYHVRWQVELVFKIWKSTFGVHKIGRMKYYRWLSILYAKLILIAIYWQAIMPARFYFYKARGKLLSVDKCFKTLKSATTRLREAMKNGDQAIQQLFTSIIALISEKHWLEKKKNKLNYEQIIYLIYCNSNVYVYI
ncbi:MAG TPA: IS4 family transposase [Williamwhitmania sp.]|nr:IS4 family transposase [Williamwhitmania sp.]